MRHLTKPGLQEFVCGIFSAISQGTAEDPKDERDQRDEASEHVKTGAADGQKGTASEHSEKVATDGLGKESLPVKLEEKEKDLTKHRGEEKVEESERGSCNPALLPETALDHGITAWRCLR